MRMSSLFVPTLKEAPKEAEVPSHQLLIRGGFIRKVAAGVYSFLPLGVRSLRKIEAIVREEMTRAGAREMLLPGVQPAELWKESGRWEQYGPELLRFQDRKGADFCLGPTHEEVVTALVRHEIRSYRDLPLNLFQIQTKFRDEMRPRAGLMRGREFIMKDAYSFDISEAAAHVAYKAMYDAYSRIFRRCGLRFRAVEADTGSIGGTMSHEFHVLADTGEDSIVSCPDCGYTANVEKAEIQAIEWADQSSSVEAMASVPTPGKHSVEEVSAFLEVEAADLLKTLIFDADEGPVAVVVPGDREVNPIKVKALLNVEAIELATDDVVRRSTGAPVGFAGPVGLEIPVLVDHHIRNDRAYITGANAGDTHLVNVVPGRDFPVSDRSDLTMGLGGDPCGRCGGEFGFYRGIEVGHVFYLGTKYSEAMNAKFLDTDGKGQSIEMGCYGIGITRTMAASVEQNHDDYGMIWPLNIAPFEVVILDLGKEDEVHQHALSISEQLEAAGVEVLFDDRKERPGVKFKDADLIGIPFQVIVGKRGLDEGVVEFKDRSEGEKKNLPLDSAVEQVVALVKEVRARLQLGEDE